MSGKRYKILCVDDEPEIHELIATNIASMGYEALCATNPKQAIQYLRQYQAEIIFIVSDYKMPGGTGLELREATLSEWKDIPFAIYSGFIDKHMALRAVDLKICAFLDKLEAPSKLVKIIEKESHDRRLSLEEKAILEASFISESAEILEELEPLLLALEANPTDLEPVNTIFRLVHTVKGSSGVLGRENLTRFFHTYEDLLAKLKSGATAVSPEVISVLLAAYDCMGKLLEVVKSGADPTPYLNQYFNVFEGVTARPTAEAATLAATATDQKTPRAPEQDKNTRKEGLHVPFAMLDEFMTLSGEITVIRNMVNKLVGSIERKLPGDQDVNMLEDLLDEMHKINSSMQTQLSELRKIPIAEVLKRLPRTVRDLSRQLGKKVSLDVDGDDLRIDTNIAQALSNSLIHMVRNCIDHAIESPEIRAKNGKPAEGLVAIQCREEHENIIIVIKDDGAGLNIDRIKKKLIDNGMYTEAEVDHMPPKRLYAHIFASGFSTAQKVTDVSGRGVGMDMVRSSIESLRGKIDIDTRLGKGTTFTITIPVPKSVVILRSLIVASAGQRFAIDQDCILRLIRLGDQKLVESIIPLEGTYVLKLDDTVIELACLSQVLGMATSSLQEMQQCLANSRELNIVLVESEQGTFGLIVDQILDAEDIVVKPLHSTIKELGLFSGATFMGDGNIGLILDLNGIANIASITSHKEADPTEEQQPESHQVATASIYQDVLLFKLHAPGSFAIPLTHVERFEDIQEDQIRYSGALPLVRYRDQLMPLIDLTEVLGLKTNEVDILYGEPSVKTIVVNLLNRSFGLCIKQIDDIARAESEIDTSLATDRGLTGSAVIKSMTTNFIDLYLILEKMGYGKWVEAIPVEKNPGILGASPAIEKSA